MHIEVSNMKITNLEALSMYIPTCMSSPILISLSNELSVHILNKDVLASDANELFILIKEQINRLNNPSISNEKGKRYVNMPMGHPTYLQSREGIIILSLLILNISIITVMYAFIVIARIIR